MSGCALRLQCLGNNNCICYSVMWVKRMTTFIGVDYTRWWIMWDLLDWICTNLLWMLQLLARFVLLHSQACLTLFQPREGYVRVVLLVLWYLLFWFLAWKGAYFACYQIVVLNCNLLEGSFLVPMQMMLNLLATVPRTSMICSCLHNSHWAT